MEMLKRSIVILALLCMAFFWISGCKTADVQSGAPALKGLPKAEALYDQGSYTEAMIECIDLVRKDPMMPGLADLQNKIVKRLAEERARVATMRAANTYSQMSTDVDSRKDVPDTYGMRRTVRGETASLRSAPTLMEQALAKKVTVHLDGVSLRDFIMAIGTSEGVNIVSDNMDIPKTMTVHAENVPLQEILDFVSRNLGVSFYVGDNIIWATPRDESQPRVPLQTRLYRLRKGISSDELSGTGKVAVVEAIERFIPKTEGADLLFEKNAHVLIVKNTRDNIAKIEELVESLDICPPQILIEARFISTGVSDLRELGIDWILNSSIAVTKNTVLKNGVPTSAAQSQIDAGATAGFTPFENNAHGLNMSYQGLLTDPMFKAVLHALETSGKSRTLSVPKVTTVNNREASIRIGEDFRYFDEFAVESIPSSVTASGSQLYSSLLVPSGTPQLEQLGIELNVTPSVGADLRSITLHILPQISEFVRYEQYEVASGNNVTTTGGATTNTTSLVKLPIFKRSKIETEVIVQSGETVVMGGLISSTESKDVEAVPFLSSLPFIGRLFKHDTVSEDKENLLIFVTANILSDRGENLVPITVEEPGTQDKPAEKPVGPPASVNAPADQPKPAGN
jgi:type IV pilus assembly protein PilQ